MKNLKNPLGLSVLILISHTLLFGSAGAESVLEKLSLPDGFHIQFYSENVPNARSMTLGDDGTVYVGTGREGKVYAVLDKNKDGKSEKVVTLLSGLNMPNGVAFRKGALYIAEISRIIRINNVAKHLNVPPKPEVVYDWYPTDVHHGWKYIRFGPDGKLYVPVGAPCNICKPKKEIYATITRMNPEGGDFEIFARGIRNTVGFDWPSYNQVSLVYRKWQGSVRRGSSARRTESCFLNQVLNLVILTATQVKYLIRSLVNRRLAMNLYHRVGSFPHMLPL